MTSTTQPPRQTVMQYSLRAIFIATFGFAVLSALIAPFLRNSPVLREAFLRTMAFASLGAVLPVILACWSRYRLERQCGARLLVISKTSNKKRGWYIALNLLGAVAMLAGDVYLNARFLEVQATLPQGWQHSPRIFFVPFVAGTYLANVLINVWWKGAIYANELCENGVILSRALVPWSSLRGYRKVAGNKMQLLIKHMVLTADVDPDKWQAATEILDARIPGLQPAST